MVRRSDGPVRGIKRDTAGSNGRRMKKMKNGKVYGSVEDRAEEMGLVPLVRPSV